MILAYIDESGTNYHKGNGYFEKDGPYALWSCVLVNEKKYFDIERVFQELSKKLLPLNLCKGELHAEKIWNSRKVSDIQDKKIRQYFEELIQFTTKLRIPVLFGVQQKNPDLKIKSKIRKEKELEKARYSLLTLMEHQLAELNENAVLVSDLEGAKEELKNLVSQRTKWRYSSTTKRITGVKPKFLFEYQSNFILDQLHYVDSKDSLLVQFSDNICFVLRRTLEHLYLLNFPKTDKNRPVADKNLVPVSESTFNTFVQLCKVHYAFYDEGVKDVSMGNLFGPLGAYYKFDEPFQDGQILLPENSIKSFTPYK